MKYAKLFSLLVVSIIGLYGAVGFYFLPLAGFEGDLTRVGMLPESMFGWTKPQPAVDPILLRSASWQEADVLVVGDSFSAPRIWQTVLVKRRLKVRTESWGGLPAICEDFDEWLKNIGFKGKYVLLEIVERNTEGTLSKSINCKKTNYFIRGEGRVSPPALTVNRTTRNLSGRLSVGIQVYLNALRYTVWNVKPSFQASKDVHVEQVANGCSLFSHLRCNQVLFFNNDRVNDMGDNILSDMATISHRISLAEPVWVIIPDKTTTYLHPEKSFWNHAESKLDAVNTLAGFRHALMEKKPVDFYFANNTHLSTVGYLELGEIVSNRLRR